MPKGFEITEEKLEELLAYDDLFLGYFNAFLSLPAFPQPLYYNRLTGTFLELDGSTGALGDSLGRPETPPYGATDEERESMLQWAKENRLPLFLRTKLFREFKLCKLLLRPLDDRHSASRGSSRNIRGYSRQTESYISSLSNSVDNSANGEVSEFGMDMSFHKFHLSNLYRYQRPGSKALSLPSRLGLFSVGSRSASSVRTQKQSCSSDRQTVSADSTKHTNAPPSALKPAGRSSGAPVDSGLGPSVPTQTRQDSHARHDNLTREVTFSTNEDLEPSRPGTGESKGYRKTPSGGSRRKHSGGSHRLVEPSEDFDAVFVEEDLDEEEEREAYVVFTEEPISDEQTVSEVKTLEGRHKMTFQEIKEHILGSNEGMQSFQSFLKGTLGHHLLNFWLDCENFKDTIEQFGESESAIIRNRLFRDIQDKYKMNLTSDARSQIARAASNVELSHTVFIRTQYDVLRRIRTYWVPRFLIHKERTNQLRQELERVSRMEMARNEAVEQELMALNRGESPGCFFPSISLVNSMPVKADDVMAIAKTTNWELVSRGGHKMEDRIKSAKVKFFYRPPDSTMREKFILALCSDKEAGGPFQTFLEKQEDMSLLSLLLFWQDVTDYGMAEDRYADRLLRMVHAWAIYNKFIADGAKYNIGASSEVRDTLHQTLLKSNDFVEASVYAAPKNQAVENLEKVWIRYLKEDAKLFLECHLRSIETPPSTAEEFEVILHEEKVLIRRERPWVARYPPSTSSERGRRLRTALSVAESIDEARRAEQKRKNIERRKQMEKERKKAVRAARLRMKEAKLMKKNVQFQQTTKPKSAQEEMADDMLPDQGLEQEEEPEKPPDFTSVLSNKPLVQLFKKYCTEMEGKDATNGVNLYLDVDAYLHIGNDKANKQKKDTQATYIYKTYMEKDARKKVHLNDKVYNRLNNEKERPKTPTLKESQHYLLPNIQENFMSFWKAQSEEMGGKNLAEISKAELSLRADNDISMLKGWSKKKGRGKSPPPLSMEAMMESADSLTPKLDRTRTDLVHTTPPASTGSTSKPAIKSVVSAQGKRSVGFSEPSREATKVSLGPREQSNASSKRKKSKAEKSIQETNTPKSRTEQEDTQSSFKARKVKKPDGRAQPTREDKQDLYMALTQAAAGHLPMKMLYFYKYLVKYGEEDNSPHLDKDLFFYCEVQKFKDCHHVYSDDEMLRRKVTSLLECYLESNTPPTLQVSISSELQQRSLRAAQRYLTGKDVSHTIFDEAQLSVFKELLPYWAGFSRSYKTPENINRVPLTKRQKERVKRLEEFLVYQPPSAKQFSLPKLPKGAVASFTFSLTEGIKWRTEDEEDAGSVEEFVMRGGATPGGHRMSIAMRREKSGGSSRASSLEMVRKTPVKV